MHSPTQTGSLSDTSGSSSSPPGTSAQQLYVTATAFVALFSIVGVALYGLPFFYDFMVKEFG